MCFHSASVGLRRSHVLRWLVSERPIFLVGPYEINELAVSGKSESENVALLRRKNLYIAVGGDLAQSQALAFDFLGIGHVTTIP
jgi:hypothetical protein